MTCTEKSNAFDDGEHCRSDEDGPCAICRRKVTECLEEAKRSYSSPLERLYDALDYDWEQRKESVDLLMMMDRENEDK